MSIYSEFKPEAIQSLLGYLGNHIATIIQYTMLVPTHTKLSSLHYFNITHFFVG